MCLCLIETCREVSALLQQQPGTESRELRQECQVFLPWTFLCRWKNSWALCKTALLPSAPIPRPTVPLPFPKTFLCLAGIRQQSPWWLCWAVMYIRENTPAIKECNQCHKCTVSLQTLQGGSHYNTVVLTTLQTLTVSPLNETLLYIISIHISCNVVLATQTKVHDTWLCYSPWTVPKYTVSLCLTLSMPLWCLVTSMAKWFLLIVCCPGSCLNSSFLQSLGCNKVLKISLTFSLRLVWEENYTRNVNQLAVKGLWCINEHS